MSHDGLDAHPGELHVTRGGLRKCRGVLATRQRESEAQRCADDTTRGQDDTRRCEVSAARCSSHSTRCARQTRGCALHMAHCERVARRGELETRRCAGQTTQWARRRTISEAATSFCKDDARLRAGGSRPCPERSSRGAGDGRRRADETTQWARRTSREEVGVRRSIERTRRAADRIGRSPAAVSLRPVARCGTGDSRAASPFSATTMRASRA
jgi:hypothetical protein